MTGMTRIITRAARRKTPRGPQTVGTELFAAGRGTSVPGTFACRTATVTVQTTGATSSGSVAAGKCLLLELFPCSGKCPNLDSGGGDLAMAMWGCYRLWGRDEPNTAHATLPPAAHKYT